MPREKESTIKLAVIIILIFVLFGAAFYTFGDDSADNYIEVSPEVEAYTPLISRYAQQYGIGEYVELIKAVMMQESGGRGTDPMQCSESPYNKKYSHAPNSIKDPEYSINCGVHYLADCLKQARCKSPIDMSRIRLALQGYNYGNGYISWAIKRDGGYTVANAIAFSDMQAKKHGWDSYGDKQYPAHVLRYYPYKNGYGVDQNYDMYVELIEAAYTYVKGVPYLSAPQPEVYTRLARIRQKQGRTDEAIDLYARAKDFLAQRITYNPFFGDLNIMKWLEEDLYELIDFDKADFDLYDLYVLLKHPVRVAFAYDGKMYEVESVEEGGSISIRFGECWYRDIDDFFAKATIAGERIPVLYEKLYAFKVV